MQTLTTKGSMITKHQFALHLRVQRILETSRRTTEGLVGAELAAIQAIHPPAAVISIGLTDPETPNFSKMPHYITCVPTKAFGDVKSKELWCSDLEIGGGVPGDGTLVYFMQELPGSGWDGIAQVRSTPSPMPCRRLLPVMHVG